MPETFPLLFNIKSLLVAAVPAVIPITYEGAEMIEVPPTVSEPQESDPLTVSDPSIPTAVMLVCDPVCSVPVNEVAVKLLILEHDLSASKTIALLASQLPSVARGTLGKRLKS